MKSTTAYGGLMPTVTIKSLSGQLADTITGTAGHPIYSWTVAGTCDLPPSSNAQALSSGVTTIIRPK